MKTKYTKRQKDANDEKNMQKAAKHKWRETPSDHQINVTLELESSNSNFFFH